jgi:toxin co-regulated pilus biosynthesis protein Q
VSTKAAVGIRNGAVALLAILMAATAGCATKPAPEYGGRWKTVNRYAEEPREIPLYEAYVFYPSPMDGTLKTMLTRWARDSKMTLSYLHSSDFTLHSAVAQIHTNDLKEAVSQLTSAYAEQGVSVTSEGNQIVVRSAAMATAAAAPGDDKAAATP